MTTISMLQTSGVFYHLARDRDILSNPHRRISRPSRTGHPGQLLSADLASRPARKPYPSSISRLPGDLSASRISRPLKNQGPFSQSGLSSSSGPLSQPGLSAGQRPFSQPGFASGQGTARQAGFPATQGPISRPGLPAGQGLLSRQ